MPGSDTQARRAIPSATVSKLREVQPKDLIIRFGLGAAVSVVAGILGKVVSVRFGGMFLAFPAILPASLTLLEEKEGTRRSGRNATGAVLGGAALAVFAGIGEAAFGHVAAGAVLLLGLLSWMVVAGLLYVVLAALRPDDCDAAQD